MKAQPKKVVETTAEEMKTEKIVPQLTKSEEALLNKHEKDYEKRQTAFVKDFVAIQKKHKITLQMASRTLFMDEKRDQKMLDLLQKKVEQYNQPTDE